MKIKMDSKNKQIKDELAWEIATRNQPTTLFKVFKCSHYCKGGFKKNYSTIWVLTSDWYKLIHRAIFDVKYVKLNHETENM